LKRYAVVIEKAQGNYSAYAPDVPGCAATGDTVEDATRQIQEALELHFEGLREDGLPLPEPLTEVAYVEVRAAAPVA
jgi:predicted RNase H-like HicB family nuclease